MYHGVPINSELIALVFGAIVWILRGVLKGLKQLQRRRGGGPAAPLLPAPPSSQASPSSQALPVRSARLDPPRERPRQPSAGGPAVIRETTRRDFQQQEQELVADEPAALNTPLFSASLPSSSDQPNALFAGTDDLIRAIILQEVLGPPLSRRSPAPVQSSAPNQAPPQ